MAERVEVIDVCDRCRSTDDVRRRQIRLVAEGNRQVTFDACALCRRTVPLEEWEQLIPVSKSSGRNVQTTAHAAGPRAIARTYRVAS